MEKKRESWLDWARAFAILSIVFCHVTEAVYQLNLDGFNAASPIARVLGQTFFTIGRLGVPIFLFLSGYLLLSRHRCNSFKDCVDFLITKWLPLLLCYEAWVLIYNGYIFSLHDLFFDGFNQTFSSIKRQILLRSTPPMPHLWYMPMIVKAYLAIPVISLIVQRFGNRAFFLTLLFCLAGSFFYSKAIYLTYICFGYFVFLTKENLKKTALTVIATLFIGSFSLLVYLQLADYGRGVAHNIWYTEHSLLFTTALLFPCFLLFDRLSNIVTKEMSRSAFAIYLLHFPILLPVLSALKTFDLNQPIACALLMIGTFSMSYAVFKCLSKVRFISKRLFLYK